MKYSIVATAFTVSSVLAGKGPKDHKSAPTTTVYATETTHKYGRFNKTPHPTTTTVVVSPSEWTSLKSASSHVRRDQIFTAVKRANDTAGAAGNSTGASGNSTGGASGNSTGGASNSTGESNAGVTASGASFAIAGAVAAGCALLM